MYNVVSRLLGRTHGVVGCPQNCSRGESELDSGHLVSNFHAVSAPALTSGSIVNPIPSPGGLWGGAGLCWVSGIPSCWSISSVGLSMLLPMAGQDVHITIIILLPLLPHGISGFISRKGIGNTCCTSTGDYLEPREPTSTM